MQSSTRALLHAEFLGTHPDGLRYTAFDRRDHRGRALRRGARREQLHVRGGQPDAERAGLRGERQPRVDLLRWRDARDRSRSVEERHRRAQLLRRSGRRFGGTVCYFGHETAGRKLVFERPRFKALRAARALRVSRAPPALSAPRASRARALLAPRTRRAPPPAGPRTARASPEPRARERRTASCSR